ncbi:class I SAM-dependent methyltransferase [Planococcus salinus]|uniref:Class I SAM-dependent methyltransferase n=1 Tax=Planococcus salinus TaxID=1848460 RepID=A0A3M8P7D8_9BACL|nr:class I SAM-dependent methyltransferase [Planococcus salinus]RNF39200.1 class I SAM-dependent methyltransferase [Planococcus salinus]
MGTWFPKFYDPLMKPLEKMGFDKVRKELIAKAEGRVLEVGSGTGANFRHYRKAVEVDATEPNPLMLKQSIKQAEKSYVPVVLYPAKAEELPFPDKTFDTVTATLVFCTIPEPEKALQEIRRVCKQGAKILLFEHVRMNGKLAGKTQDLLTPIWKKAFDGCHLNRNTLELVKRSGLIVLDVTSYSGGLFLVIECVNG